MPQWCDVLTELPQTMVHHTEANLVTPLMNNPMTDDDVLCAEMIIQDTFCFDWSKNITIPLDRINGGWGA